MLVFCQMIWMKSECFTCHMFMSTRGNGNWALSARTADCLSPKKLFCHLTVASVRPVSSYWVSVPGWRDNLQGPSTKNVNGCQCGVVATNIIWDDNKKSQVVICVFERRRTSLQGVILLYCVAFSWVTTPLSLLPTMFSLVVYMCVNLLFLMWYLHNISKSCLLYINYAVS